MGSSPASDQALANALQRSEPLTGLLQRVRESQERLAAIAPLLPSGLAGAVRAGPLDDAAWMLLVANAAAAAKVRQLLPALQATLQANGFAERLLQIKVRPRAV